MEDAWKSAELSISAAYWSINKFCHGSEFTINVAVPLIIMISVYWITSAFFTILDLTGSPASIAQFKIPEQSKTRYPRVSLEKLREVVLQVLINQTVVAVPVIYTCYLLKSRWGYNDGVVVPSLHRFIFDVVVQILTEEVFFYYSHRFLHFPPIYRLYHKKHHEWISPIAVTAIYCHPVEHILSNVLPTFAGSVVAGCHVISLWAWLTFATFYGVVVHSGYHLPFTPTPEFHHYHHQKSFKEYNVCCSLKFETSCRHSPLATIHFYLETIICYFGRQNWRLVKI